MSIDVGPTPSIGTSAWLNPEEIQPSKEGPLLSEEKPKDSPPRVVTPVSTTLGAVVEEAPKRLPVVTNPIMNTPNQAGRMLNTQRPVTSPDPWAGRALTKEPVVQPGARIKLGPK